MSDKQQPPNIVWLAANNDGLIATDLGGIVWILRSGAQHVWEKFNPVDNLPHFGAIVVTSKILYAWDKKGALWACGTGYDAQWVKNAPHCFPLGELVTSLLHGTSNN